MTLFGLRDRKTKTLYSVHADKDSAEGALDKHQQSRSDLFHVPAGSYAAMMGALRPAQDVPDFEIVALSELDALNYILTQLQTTQLSDALASRLPF